jgi:benzoyl-CoA reductase subunit D
MHTAGIDVGARMIKVVLLRDGTVVGHAKKACGFDPAGAVGEALDRALQPAGLPRSAIDCIATTGVEGEQAPQRSLLLDEIDCAARGAAHLLPETRTVIDVGFEAGRAIRLDRRAQIVDSAVNDQCASGSGALAEMIARLLEVPIDELGPLSRQGNPGTALAAQCAVFVESAVVSMIHDNVGRAEIARAVHETIAGRIVSLVCKMGFDRPVALVGGMARDLGFVDALQRGLELERIEIPPRPDFCGALGAALAAADPPRSR